MTRVVLTDVSSGTFIGAVVRADSVAALSALYGRIAGGWAEGPASSPEIGATFYHDSAPTAFLALGYGSFEARPGGRVLRRSARPDEALEFVRLAGVPIKYLRSVGSSRLSIVSLVVAQVACPMLVLRADTALLESMPIAVADTASLEQMPVSRSACENSLGGWSHPSTDTLKR